MTTPPPNLTLETSLDYARCAVAVLRALKMIRATMTYQQFAKAIGAMPADGTWSIKYRDHHVKNVLTILGAVERLVHENDLDFGLVVNKETGQPGAGFHKNHHIVEI